MQYAKNAFINIKQQKHFQIEQVSPGFSDRYLLQPEQFSHELEQYHKYIKSMISIADNTSDAGQFADDIIDFSKKLAKVGKLF